MLHDLRRATARGLSSVPSSRARGLDPEDWGRRNDLLFRLHSESGLDQFTGEFSHLVPGYVDYGQSDSTEAVTKKGDLLWGSYDADERESGGILLRRRGSSNLSWLAPGGTWIRGEYNDVLIHMVDIEDLGHWLHKFDTHFDKDGRVDTRRYWLREVRGVREPKQRPGKALHLLMTTVLLQLLIFLRQE